MCRWLAYSGAPIAPEELIFKTQYSLIEQSLSARASASTTNSDGFGVGWYDHCATPGIYKHIQPAWNDGNLRDLCEHVRSPMFLAHIRAATGTAVQRSNCHPEQKIVLRKAASYFFLSARRIAASTSFSATAK